MALAASARENSGQTVCVIVLVYWRLLSGMFIEKARPFLRIQRHKPLNCAQISFGIPPSYLFPSASFELLSSRLSATGTQAKASNPRSYQQRSPRAVDQQPSATSTVASGSRAHVYTHSEHCEAPPPTAAAASARAFFTSSCCSQPVAESIVRTNTLDTFPLALLAFCNVVGGFLSRCSQMSKTWKEVEVDINLFPGDQHSFAEFRPEESSLKIRQVTPAWTAALFAGAR